MDSPSKAKTASTTSKSKKRYVKPELTKISPSTAKVILQAKADCLAMTFAVPVRAREPEDWAARLRPHASLDDPHLAWMG